VKQIPVQSQQDLYQILKQTNQLPQTITADNIDGSIKTLALLLQKLQQQQKNPHQEQQSYYVNKVLVFYALVTMARIK